MVTAAPRRDPSTPSAAPPPATTTAGPEVRLDAVAVRVELAQTAAERTRGLGGHAPLGADEGMLFVFPAAGPALVLDEGHDLCAGHHLDSG